MPSPSCSRPSRPRFSALHRGVPLVALLAAAAAGVHAEVSTRTVALTREAAPGTEPGVVFSAFTTPLNHSIMSPQIDDEGNVSFIAFLSGPGVDFTNQIGIWSERSSNLSLTVRKGDVAPGTEPGTTFSGIPNDEVPFPPNVANGRTGFFGMLTGPEVGFTNDGGLWIDDDELELLVREDDPVAGAPGVRFGGVGLLGLDNAGGAYVQVDLTGSGINSDNDDAVWANRNGSFAPVVREGQDAPGTNVQFARGELGTFMVFPQTRFNGLSRATLEATLNGTGVTAFNDEAIFLEDAVSGELELLLREGDPAPGVGPGVTFGGNSVSLQVMGLTINDLGETAFNLRLGGALPTTTAMFSTRQGVLQPEIVPGDPAPGTDTDFSIFGSPTLSQAGGIAFRAAVEPGFFPGFGVWWDESGELTPLVLPDDVLDTRIGPQIFTGSSFIAGYNARGEIAIVGGLEDLISGLPRNGLLIAGPSGELELVAATGELFDARGDGSDRREVLRVTHGRLGEGGTLAFRLDFVDGSSGHFAAVREQVIAPDLSLAGNCPGPITITIDGLTPNGTVALANGAQDGVTIVPVGPCAGTEIDLADAHLLTTQPIDAEGLVTLERNAPAAACGTRLQALDLESCAVSNVIVVPSL